MAAADYILCDKCYGKIVYDTDDIIFEALVKLGFSGLPIRCGRCSDKDNLMFSYQFGAGRKDRSCGASCLALLVWGERQSLPH